MARTAASLRVVALHEAVMLLAHGADPEKRLPMQVTRPSERKTKCAARSLVFCTTTGGRGAR